MATKRTRISRNIIKEIDPELLAYISDDLLGEPREGHSLRWFILGEKGFQKLWNEHKEAILKAWIKEYPGTRPRHWWKHSAPRITRETLKTLGRGIGWIELRMHEYCEPRKRLAGIGTPNYEVLNYVPSFDCGIPDSWVEKWAEDYYNGRKGPPEPPWAEYHEGDFTGKAIDPNDPPRYESQAAYLKRFGFLTLEEERKLKPEDLEPEVVLPEPDEEETIQ